MGLNKRGFYFTVDAIIFAVILFGAISLVHVEQSQTASQPKSAFLAKDIMHVLETITVQDLYNQNNTWVKSKFAAGNITNLNQSIITQIGEFWAKGDIPSGQQLIQEVFNGTVSSYQSFGVWVENEHIDASAASPQVSQSVSWRLVSGLEKNKPMKGFVASARATKLFVNNTLSISISPQGAGWHTGFVNITKMFNLSNITITNAVVQLSTHTDQTASDLLVYLNNCNLTRSSFTWLFAGADGNVGNRTVTSCLQQNINNITMQLRNTRYSAHTHPGLLLLINYSAEVPLEAASTKISKRFYFDNDYSLETAASRSGVWQLVPFHIPNGATNISVYMQVATRHVFNYISSAANGCVKYVDDSGEYCNSPAAQFVGWDGANKNAATYDYIMFFNANTPFDSNGTPQANYTYKYQPSVLNSKIKNGTNVVTVYINNYGDYVWGQNKSQIYSSPFADPSNSSYVEVNYTLNTVRPYSTIEITQTKLYGGVASNDVTQYFQYPSQAVYKGDTFLQIVQQYSSIVRVWAGTTTPPTNQIYLTPASRAVPTTVFADSSYFDLSPTARNYIRAQDTGGSGNKFLPISAIEYHFFVPSSVGYGNVFSTQSQAINDSLARLLAVTGSYLNMQTIDNDTASIQDVPTLWGPAIVEVRAWN